MNTLKAGSIGTLLKETFREWSRDKATRLSAALAYYATFSIAPLLIIAVGLAGWFFGPDAVSGQLQSQLQGTMGPQASQAIQTMVQSASKPSSSMLATVLGFGTLLLGASGVFAQLKEALNTIWGVEPRAGAVSFVRERLLSFGMVLTIGFLLLVSLVLTTVLSTVSKHFSQLLPYSGVWISVGGTLISLAIVTLLFALIFKLLPDVKLQWSDVWVGAAVTAVLFEIGKILLALYLGRVGTSSTYGAATSVVLLLLWVYYASCILFVGAEFTKVYAQRTGAKIAVKDNAQPVTTEMRARPGLIPPAGEVQAPPPPEPQLVPVPVYTPPAGPPLPHSFAEVPGFFRESPAASILTAAGCGYAVGMIARHRNGRRTPVEEIAHGSRTLALAALPLATNALREGFAEAIRRFNLRALSKAAHS